MYEELSEQWVTVKTVLKGWLKKIIQQILVIDRIKFVVWEIMESRRCDGTVSMVLKKR